MDTSRTALLKLLELQKVDSVIDRLEARLRHLPEQATLDSLEARRQELESEIATCQAAFNEVTTRQKRVDYEVDSVGQKLTIEERRLYSGTVNSSKELSDLSREVEALKRRKAILEDQDLDVMEEREGVEKQLHALTGEHSALLAQIEAQRRLRDEASGDVGVQLSAAQAERNQKSPAFDPALLALYDSIRASKGGVGAAAMVEGVCQGCHIRMPAQEAERVRQATGLTRCDECRRILVVL